MELTRRTFLRGAALMGITGAVSPAALAKPRLPFPELKAHGSPGNIGHLHGRTFAGPIKENLETYIGWLSRITSADREGLLRVAKGFAAVLKEHLPHQLEEIDGIARGSGRRLEEILLINARTDLLVAGRRAARSKSTPGCTALALSGHQGKQPLIALGQNWDWLPEFSKRTLVMRVTPQSGPRLVTFTEAGMVGKIGFNEHGLGVCLNFLGHKSEDPARPLGVPIHCLLRAVMECKTLEEAFKMVSWLPRCASGHFLMAQHHRAGSRALSVELTPSAVASLAPLNGDLVHTNHFKDPALSPGCDSGFGVSTTNRHRVGQQLASKWRRSIADPAARMRKILESRAGAPYSVSKTAAADSKSVTLAGIVMDLSRNRLFLAAGPPHRGRWVQRPGV